VFLLGDYEPELVIPEIPVKFREAVQTFPSGNRFSDIQRLAYYPNYLQHQAL